MSQVGLGGIELELTGAPYFESADIGPQDLFAVSVGHEAGNVGAVTGNYWTAVGYGALSHQTTAIYSTAVGYGALHNLTTGNFNTAYGFNAMMGGAAITGGSNCAFGDECMGGIVDGALNTAMGATALEHNSSGNNSTAIGYGAAHAATGGYHTVVGMNAMSGCTTGVGNTVVGQGAMLTGNGSLNVCIGIEAGYWETGNSRLYIDNARRLNEADARAKALIYGLFDAATANQRVTINGHFNVLLSEVLMAANNAAAAAAGVQIGDLYRTNADPSVLCIRSA